MFVWQLSLRVSRNISLVVTKRLPAVRSAHFKREAFRRLFSSGTLRSLLASETNRATYHRMANITPDNKWGNQPYASKTVTRHSTPLRSHLLETSRSLPVGSRSAPFQEEGSMQLSPVVGQGENGTTQVSEWEGANINKQPSSRTGNHVRRTLSWDGESTGERSTRLHELEVTLLQNSRLYRRRLTTRLVCVFCCLVLLGVVICFTSVALLVRNETPRGILVGYDGSFQLKPTNKSYCVKGSPSDVAAYRKNIIRVIEQKLDAVFRNLSVESSYSGSVVEDFACVLRPSTDYATTHVYFVILWRQRRAKGGTLEGVPDPQDLLNKFFEYLQRHQHGTSSEFDIDKDTIKIAGHQRIL